MQTFLEKIKIPTFTGKLKDWEKFKAEFTEMVIKDKGINNSVKFSRLNNCLSGEAQDLLVGIKSIGENFDLAWKTICRHYDNLHRRFVHQMDALHNLSVASEETS